VARVAPRASAAHHVAVAGARLDLLDGQADVRAIASTLAPAAIAAR
jgi:hypothetical protein